MSCKFCGGDHTPPLSGQTGEPRLEICVKSLAAEVQALATILSEHCPRLSALEDIAANPGLSPAEARALVSPPTPPAEDLATIRSGPMHLPQVEALAASAQEPSPVELEPAAEPVKEG